ncbi:ribbon-helix-helix domain-containing protein [Peptostreptococcus russellii]|uniref:ribbon-helix-helix domain-containing protein n=1 Tax=Peptostreptococcus russellii TaxID=215200 RepID=UPI003FA76FED
MTKNKTEITLRIPNDLYEALKKISDETGIPVAHIITISLVEKYFIDIPANTIHKNDKHIR